jgi:crotonobetainyl-CoA:carnitine CoA-transferase CaiB-like acyl-CoA transferase
MLIVDLSTDVAGRFAAKLFAMAGETVVRPLLEAEREDVLTQYIDAAKERRVAPPAEVQALVESADLIFQSFDRGKCLGLAAEVEIPGDKVVITTSSYGTTGPYSRFGGSPICDWAAGGYLFITGEPKREPLMGPDHLCGYVAGYAAALSAEAALARKRRTGEGEAIDISVMEVMLGLHQSTLSRANAGMVRTRTGRYAEVYPLSVLPCRDGYVSLGVVTDDEFDKLAIALDRPDLVADERFATQALRFRNRDALDIELDQTFSITDADNLVAMLQDKAVPATSAVDALQVLANPQLRSRGFWSVAEGSAGKRMPGNPLPPGTAFGEATSAEGRAELDAGASDTRPPNLPLSGVVVLDLSAFWAGPSATRLLADLGAEVIWIERPGSRIDVTDGTTPAAQMAALYHEKMNRHKRSLVLDLNKPDDQAKALELAKRADVLMENYRPGVAARLGMGPADLCALNPALVYVSLSGFGAAGPWGQWRSFGPNIEAASSILARTGYRDGPPMRMGHALPDGVGGLVGALAAVRGLRERAATGRGGWHDISQLEAYAALSGEDILAADIEGKPTARRGNDAASDAIIRGVFSCKGEDQWIALEMGVEDVVTLERVSERPSLIRQENGKPVLDKQGFGVFTAKHEKRALAAMLQEAGIAAFPVLDGLDILADPHLEARGFLAAAQRDDVPGRLPGFPAWSAKSLACSHGKAPKFGDGEQDVLRWLGHPPKP